MRSSLVVFAALVLWVGRADAGRKRLVVLDFEGPKAEKFHADVVKMVKKSHTVLTVDKWNDKADEMDAAAVTDKNIRKVAKKLKIDGVITGKIEKRRESYIIRLKLRGGTTGETVGNPVQTQSESPRIDANAQRDIKDELMPAIDELESIRGSSDEEEEEEEDAPKSKRKKNGDDEEEESGGFVKKGKMRREEEEEEVEDPKAAKKRKAEEEKRRKAEEEEAKRLAKEDEKRKKEEDARRKEEAKRAEEAFTKSKAKKREVVEEEEEEEEAPKKRASADEEEEDDEEGAKAKKRKASSDEEDEEAIEESASEEDGGGRDLSVAGRALDAVVGMSFTARNLKFAYQSDLAKPPPGYKQPLPVAGALIDVTAYPLAFGKTQGLMRGLGITLLYDRVLLINSQKKYADDQGVQRIADLSTSESRWAVGPVFRYPMGKFVVGGSLTYGKQQFSIKQALPNNQPTDIPSVEYTIVAPAGFIRYPVTPKITANGDLAFLGVMNTGQIQASGMTGYGAATVTGFELEAGADYMVKKNIFARVSLRYQTFGFTFKGDPTSQTNIRDTDPMQDVTGARDTYFGGAATVGYVY